MAPFTIHLVWRVQTINYGLKAASCLPLVIHFIQGRFGAVGVA